MNVEDVYSFIEDAERMKTYLEAETARFGERVTAYYHTTEGRCEIDVLKAVNNELIVEESREFANTLEYYENLLSKIPEVKEELKDCSNNKMVEGEVLDRSDLSNDLDSLRKEYQELMSYAMEEASRTVLDPNVSSPIGIKSARRRERDHGNEELFELIV